MHSIGLNNIYHNNLEEFLTRHCNTAFMLNMIAILFSAYCLFNIL